MADANANAVNNLVSIPTLILCKTKLFEIGFKRACSPLIFVFKGLVLGFSFEVLVLPCAMDSIPESLDLV